MTRKKLNRVWKEIGAAKRRLPKLADLESLARMCGRRPYPGGKHVMWISTAFPQHRAFPIPRHGGDPVASYPVRDTVLEHLEADAVAWEEIVDDDDDDEGDEGVNGDGDGTQ